MEENCLEKALARRELTHISLTGYRCVGAARWRFEKMVHLWGQAEEKWSVEWAGNTLIWY